jgi:hypothetical protein
MLEVTDRVKEIMNNLLYFRKVAAILIAPTEFHYALLLISVTVLHRIKFIGFLTTQLYSPSSLRVYLDSTQGCRPHGFNADPDPAFSTTKNLDADPDSAA